MEVPKRKSIRLKDFDYSYNGMYFVIICVRNIERLLINLNNEVMLVYDIQLKRCCDFKNTGQYCY